MTAAHNNFDLIFRVLTGASLAKSLPPIYSFADGTNTEAPAPYHNGQLSTTQVPKQEFLSSALGKYSLQSRPASQCEIGNLAAKNMTEGPDIPTEMPRVIGGAQLSDATARACQINISNC